MLSMSAAMRCICIQATLRLAAFSCLDTTALLLDLICRAIKAHLPIEILRTCSRHCAVRQAYDHLAPE